ncbi:DNA repair and recombination protein RAD54B-like [Leptopilina heterotoma]|uniref:DNA repair and recombination protein RAD54B-like n=1 Tax=Leptopilina heterotoma TaxID=63436 RepID=UPI001CA97511|nr:DNA repair and recombination protein RAD54B-like [Leptopilina heterotoma]
MNRNYRAQGRSTAHILQLFNKKANKPEVEEEKSLDSQESSEGSQSASSSQKNLTNVSNDDKINDSITYNVLIGKKSNKKHKTWDEDGILIVSGTKAVLKDPDGKFLGKLAVTAETATEGSILSMGGKEIQIIDRVSSNIPQKSEKKDVISEPPLKKLKTHNKFIPLSKTGKGLGGLLQNYEPLIMPRPNEEINWTEENCQIRDVSLDACLATVLRPHQRYGLVFLYKCIMGMNDPNYFGAILADEMGLGKTLQCVALTWTLLKQGPYGKAILKRVLVVAPSSLCGNWNNEFIRWLGIHRISPFVIEGKKKPKDFLKSPRASVMIISYEMFVRNFEEVNEIGFDLLICDEGHRLKNSELKSLKMLNQLTCRRRILLTGTPVQNDLQELYTLVDFVNPDILETSNFFRKHYENPIVASQKPDASEEVISLGQERAEELHEKTKVFILRRTNDLINKYLPSKHELVIFCRLTPEQNEIYTKVTDLLIERELLKTNVMPLAIITALKKICNHPNLFLIEKSNLIEELKTTDFCMEKSYESFNYSVKMNVVRALLRELKGTSENVVLVSYFTKTLDLLEKLCNSEGMSSCRLDGSTATTGRTKIVDKFNSKGNTTRVFLLSAKAGGVGLNLVGASRLVLFDSDWNPASDAQAMARIWRDGQKKSVYIYRLLTTGTIEEKIYQRQISKTSLSEAVVDANHLASLKLSTSELKDLFTLTTDTCSLTHDLMDCSCDKEDIENEDKENDVNLDDSRICQLDLQTNSEQPITINQLLRWKHYNYPVSEELLKELLMERVSECITFIFQNSSTEN